MCANTSAKLKEYEICLCFQSFYQTVMPIVSTQRKNKRNRKKWHHYFRKIRTKWKTEVKISPNKNSPIIFVGCIGAGKTTVMNGLKRKRHNRRKIKFDFENVDAISRFASAKKNDNLTQAEMQMLIVQKYENREKEMLRWKGKQTGEANVNIQERWKVDAFVFGLAAEGIGKKKKEHLWRMMRNIEVNKIIYIRTNPEVCYERIQKRMAKDSKRNFEKPITLEYLRRLSSAHDAMYNPETGFLKEFVYVVDGTGWVQSVIRNAVELMRIWGLHFSCGFEL